VIQAAAWLAGLLVITIPAAIAAYKRAASA